MFSICIRSGDGVEEFQKLGRANDGVGDAGGLDQFLLGDLGEEIAAVGHPIGSDDARGKAAVEVRRSRTHPKRTTHRSPLRSQASGGVNGIGRPRQALIDLLPGNSPEGKLDEGEMTNVAKVPRGSESPWARRWLRLNQEKVRSTPSGAAPPSTPRLGGSRYRESRCRASRNKLLGQALRGFRHCAAQLLLPSIRRNRQARRGTISADPGSSIVAISSSCSAREKPFLCPRFRLPQGCGRH
jgi:hypothetical protein